MEKNLLMTSGYNFDGYNIKEYLGVFSGECALGTGFLSSLGAGFADFFGTNSKMYSGKLKKAKDFAIDQLSEQVISVGGNAIIGLDIDYVSFSADIMGVVASGTAVKLCSDSVSNNAKHKYSITITNSNLPFRASSLYVNSIINDNYGLSLELFHVKDCPVSAILADIVFTDIFQQEILLNNISFIEFSNQTSRELISSTIYVPIPSNIFRILSNIRLNIKKYILDSGLIELSEDELQYSDFGESLADKSNEIIPMLLLKANSFNSAKEIYQYIVDYSEKYIDIINPTLISKLESAKNIERFYGNNKNEAIEILNNYFSGKAEEN